MGKWLNRRLDEYVGEPNFVHRLDPKSTVGPLKLDELSNHSRHRQLVWHGRLIQPKGPRTEWF